MANEIFHVTVLLILANVNSRSRSFARPSVCRLSVTFVHPTQAIEIFRNVSTEIVPEEPLRRGLNAKYSDLGPFQGCISKTVQDTRLVTINH